MIKQTTEWTETRVIPNHEAHATLQSFFAGNLSANGLKLTKTIAHNEAFKEVSSHMKKALQKHRFFVSALFLIVGLIFFCYVFVSGGYPPRSLGNTTGIIIGYSPYLSSEMAFVTYEMELNPSDNTVILGFYFTYYSRGNYSIAISLPYRISSITPSSDSGEWTWKNAETGSITMITFHAEDDPEEVWESQTVKATLYLQDPIADRVFEAYSVSLPFGGSFTPDVRKEWDNLAQNIPALSGAFNGSIYLRIPPSAMITERTHGIFRRDPIDESQLLEFRLKRLEPFWIQYTDLRERYWFQLSLFLSALLLGTGIAALVSLVPSIEFKMMRILAWLIRLYEHSKTYKPELLGAALVSLVTFAAGSFIDYFYRGLNPFENPAIVAPLVISVPFFVWWLLSTYGIYQRLAKALMKSRFVDPKIAVLSLGKMNETDIKDLLRHTVYTPELWYERLRSSNLKAEKITDLTMKDDYSAIVNPFGELYLEEDIRNLKTFQHIKEYIKRGGVFVNTAGLSFYYMWNPKTRTEGLTGPMLETYRLEALPGVKKKGSVPRQSAIILRPIVIPDDSSLIDSWLYKNFGVRTTLGRERSLDAKAVSPFDDVIDRSARVTEFRSAVRCESSESRLIPIIRCEYEYGPTSRKHECYPIAAVKYGIGYLILVGMILKEEKDFSLVIRTIKKISEILNETGSLEMGG